MPEDGEGDHLVKNAAELVAATHVADDHDVGIDHAGRLGSRLSLVALAQATQSIQSFLRGGGSDHVDSHFSEPVRPPVSQRDGAFLPELLRRPRTFEHVMSLASSTSMRIAEARTLVLRLPSYREGHTPVFGTSYYDHILIPF